MVGSDTWWYARSQKGEKPKRGGGPEKSVYNEQRKRQKTGTKIKQKKTGVLKPVKHIESNRFRSQQIGQKRITSNWTQGWVSPYQKKNEGECKHQQYGTREMNWGIHGKI